MQVKLKGLFKVRRKLVSGDYRVHYYAWRGGPKMRTEYGTPEFVAEFDLHHQLKAGKFTQSTTGAARFELATPCSQNSRSFADLFNYFNYIAFGEV